MMSYLSPCLQVRKDMRLSGFNRPLDCEQHFQRAIWKLHHSVVVGKLALRTLDLLLGITGGTQMPTKAQMLAQVPTQEAADPPAHGRHLGTPCCLPLSGRCHSCQLRGPARAWSSPLCARVPS